MPSKKIGALSADLVLEIDNFLSPIKSAQAEIKEFDKLAKPLTKTIDDIGESLISAGKAATVGLTLPLVAAGTAAVKSYAEQAKAIALMENAIRSTGDASGKTSKQLQDMSEALQKNSVFGDEKILQSVITQLLTFTNISGDAFDRATKAALDMSTVLGQDLQSSAIQLGKALNSPVDGVTALQRVGVRLTAAQKESVKAFMAVNDIASAQAVILAEVEKEFGGAAEAASKAGLGPFTQLANKLDDLGEKFGKLILDDLTPLLKYLDDAIDYVDGLSDSTKSAIVVVAGFAAAIGPVLLALGAMALSVNQIIGAYGQLAIWLPKVALAAQSAGITMAAAANAVPWIALAAELVYVAKLLYDINSAKQQTAAMDAQTATLQQKNIKTLHDLGIEYDATGKSIGEVNKETAKLLQQYYGTQPGAAVAAKATRDVTFESKEYTDAIKKQREVETAWRAVQAGLYKEHVDAAAKFVDAWLGGFDRTSRAADDYTEALQRTQVATSKLAYSSVDAAVVIQTALQTAGNAWEGANQKAFGSSAHLFNQINGLRETDVDAAVVSATKRVKADEEAATAQINEAKRYSDAFIDSIANLNTRFGESFADMIVHAKFNMDSLTSIAQDTAKNMLSAFLSGLLSPLTNELANLGKSLSSVLFGGGGGITSAVTGAGGAGLLGSLFGGGGAAAGTAGTAGAAGGSAGGGSLFGAIGGIGATGAATLGIGAAVAGAIALVKSQAHWEANTFVKELQEPLINNAGTGIINQLVNSFNSKAAAGSLSYYEATEYVEGLRNIIGEFDEAATQFGLGGSDEKKVADQGKNTVESFADILIADMEKVISGLNPMSTVQASSAFHGFDGWDLSQFPQYKVGTPYVPHDMLAMIHKGERIVPEPMNRVYGGGGGWGGQNAQASQGVTNNFTFHLEAGAEFDEGLFRTKLLPMWLRALKLNTGGAATETTITVKRGWNGLAAI